MSVRVLEVGCYREEEVTFSPVIPPTVDYCGCNSYSPSVESPELTYVLLLKPGAGQNTVMHTSTTYLSTHTVYQYKIQFFDYLGGIWPYWKMDTGKHNFHEILLLF